MVNGLYDLWLLLWFKDVPQKSLKNISLRGVLPLASSLFTIASVSSNTKDPFSRIHIASPFQGNVCLRNQNVKCFFLFIGKKFITRAYE